MGFIQRRLLRAVLGVVARPRLTLLIAGLFLAASVALAWTRLSMSTDQNRLFSSKVKFFRDWQDFNEKFPENQALYVLIQAKDPAHPPPQQRWIELADRIATRLNPVDGLPQYVVSVDSHVPMRSLSRSGQGLLFDSPADLEEHFRQTKELGPLAALWNQPGAAPMGRFLNVSAALPLSAQQEAGLANLAKSLAQGWTQAMQNPAPPIKRGNQVPDLEVEGAADPRQLGYYYETDQKDPKQKLLLVRVYPRENHSSLAGHAEPVERIKAACAEVALAFPDFDVGVTGRPAIEADEMRITDQDSNRAETLAMIAIFCALVFMLRSVWLALAAEVCLGVGIGWTFGWATLSVGELNLLSIVFIIALIGIGMDYLVQLLMRYRVEARRYIRPAAAWARVFRYVSPPTLTACLGAAGAFWVSVFTDFRGAAELGIIAGGGLLLCLLAGCTVLPALLVVFPPRLKPYAPQARYIKAPPLRPATRRMVLPVTWLALLLAGIPWALRMHFDSNLLNLQSRHLQSVTLVGKLQTWSAVVLSGDLETLRKARAAVQDAPSVAGTQSILDAYDNLHWLQAHRDQVPAIAWAAPQALGPGDLPALAAAAQGLAGRFDRGPKAPKELRAAAAALRRFAQVAAATNDPARAAQRLSQCQVVFVDELHQMLDQLSPRDVNLAALPPELRSHFQYQSPDGDAGHNCFALYINPRQNLWRPKALDQFMVEISQRIKTLPDPPTITGIAADIYNTTKKVKQSFYAATMYALALIFVVVLIDLRNVRQTLLAISVLAAGLPMLIVLMGLMGTSWNFANFFALPILIGAGHEYGVFLMHRYREARHNPRRVWRRWDSSDRALLLCALVTSSSFGFFWWTADHEGLRSLGLVMSLGSACIYLASVMVVRPLLIWRLESLRWKKLRQHQRDETGMASVA